MDNKSQEEPLFQRGASQDDSFYDTIDKSPEFDNSLNDPNSNLSPEERERQRESLQGELAKLDEEITTLRSVLSTKQREAALIKRKLGITPMKEMTTDLKTSLNNIKESDTYQKTGQAFKNMGAWSSKKMGDMRNSNTFKSFEEKVGGAYTSMKGRVTGSRSEQNFDEALRAAQAENSSANSPQESKPL